MEKNTEKLQANLKMDHLKPFHSDQMSLISKLLKNEFKISDLRSNALKPQKYEERKVVIENEGEIKEVRHDYLKHIKSTNTWDLLLFSKKAGIDAESSSD